VDLGVSPEAVDEPNQFFNSPSGFGDQPHCPLVIIFTGVGGIRGRVIDGGGGQFVAGMAI
jgi:hypothetical protein